MFTEFETNGRHCMVYADEEPEMLLVEAIDARELEGLDAEISAIKDGCKHRFAYVALIVEDWNKELAPWTAPPVYGKVPFGNGAAASPSVWYPRWMDYAGHRKPNARRVYLSLGDAEAKTKHPVMATVADNITALYDMLKMCPSVRSFLHHVK